jgi:hypothetical protein
VSFLHTHERKREKQINKIPQIFVIHFMCFIKKNM